MFCIFLFWINTIIHVLPEASIREITGCINPKIYQKRQSVNLPDFIICNTKKNKCIFYIGTVLSLCNFVGVQKENCRGAGRNCLLLVNLNGFISNPNPYIWISSPIHLVGYSLDIDYIHFWLLLPAPHVFLLAPHNLKYSKINFDL